MHVLGNAPAGQAFVEVLDTSDTAPDRRFDTWRDLVGETCGPLRVERGAEGDFTGTIVHGQFGPVRTALVTADPHAVERTPRLIRRADHPNLYVCAMLDGEARVTQDGHAATARVGNLVAFDSARPYTLAMHRRFRMVFVTFAHGLVGLTPRDTQSLVAAGWSAQHGVGVLLCKLLDGLADHMTEVSPASAERLGDSVGNLVVAMFTERLRDAAPDPGVARRALLLRVQAFAREHLADPALSPAMLARHHHISLRYLQVLFQEQETSPARWIRDQRLSRCHDDLRNPRYDHLTVASIGERWGLPGASHFSRLFRERYQVTPREYRREWQLTGRTLRRVV